MTGSRSMQSVSKRNGKNRTDRMTSRRGRKDLVSAKWLWLLAALPVLLLYILIAWNAEVYLDLNDDVLIRDILSGVYSGEPSYHTMQLLAPLAMLLSLPYQILPMIPWYGILMCLFQMTAIWMITYRLLRYTTGRVARIAALLAVFTGVAALFLRYLVFMHYTVTAGLLMAAAALWFMTSDSEQEDRFFLRDNLLAVGCVILAFWMRSEMGLLLLPLLGIAGIIKYFLDTTHRGWKVFMKRYGSIFGLAALGMVAGFLLDLAAYAGDDWSEFRDLFEARTQLYDYYKIPEYEANVAFYEEIGLTKEDQQLLDNYNYGLSSRIHAGTLTQIAEYAQEQQGLLGKTWREALWDYRYRLTHAEDAPYLLLVYALYLILLLQAFSAKRKDYYGLLLLLFATRSSLWFFLQLRARVPERITLPLYLMEMMILLGMLLWHLWKYRKPFTSWSLGMIALVVLSIYATTGAQEVATEYNQRMTLQGEWEALQDYCKAHPEQYYYLDVYSTVDYSERAVASLWQGISNYEILGGWIYGSPLMQDKHSQFGIEQALQAVLEGEAQVVVSYKRDADWLINYCNQNAEGNYALVVEDTILVSGEQTFLVYQVAAQ